MAIVVTNTRTSYPLVEYSYTITGLVNGANTITLPTPPAVGSFPPAWQLDTDLCLMPSRITYGAVGAVVTVDPSTIVNTAGAVTFTLYASGSCDCWIHGGIT